MNFENRLDAVAITSANGEAIVPGTKAVAVARAEADATGKPVTIRDAITDNVLATIRPASVVKTAEAAAPAAACRRRDDGATAW